MFEYDVTLEVKNQMKYKHRKECFEPPVGMPLYWVWCTAICRAIDKLKDDERIVSISVKEIV